jgi:hypothetical protein
LITVIEKRPEAYGYPDDWYGFANIHGEALSCL